MTKKLILGLIVVFCLAVSFVSAAGLPFDPSDLPGAREARAMFGQIPGHVDWNPDPVDVEVDPVVELRNIRFNREVVSTNQVQKYYVTFDVVNLVDREISNVDVRITFGVGNDFQQRVGHTNPIFDPRAEPLAPHEIRHEKIAFDIEPCDLGLKELEFYVYISEILDDNQYGNIATIGRASYHVDLIQNDECRVQQLNGVRIENIQFSQNIQSQKVLSVFTVAYDIHNTLNVPVQDVAITGLFGVVGDQRLDVAYFSPVMDPNAVPLAPGEVRHKQMSFNVVPCTEGVRRLTLTLDAVTIDAQRRLVIDHDAIQELGFDVNVAKSAECNAAPANNGGSQGNGAEDLPIDDVQVMNDLEDQFNDYKDNYNEYSEAYEDAQNLNDKNHAERDLERLDQKLEDLKNDINDLQEKDDDVINDRAQRLENKVEELRNQIEALLTGKEAIDDKEPDTVDLGLKETVKKVSENGFSATGLTVKVTNWSEISWYLLLIVGILIVLGLIIWLLSYIFNY